MADDEAMKAGRRHSASDQAILRALRDDMRAHATKVTEYLSALGYGDEDGDGVVSLADAVAAVKAGDLPDAGDASTWATVKALGERTLELRVAWGMDGHKEQFTPGTDFDLEHFPAPPVAYYHGYTEAGKPAPRPVYIGKTIARENRADGHYITAKLNSKPEADKVWAAALKGQAYVSPGTVGHLRRKAPDGTLTYWPIAEISAWDGAPSRKQAHPASLAFPVLKALYDEGEIPLPPVLSETPEAAGDAAAAPTDIDPQTAREVIVAEVARALLTHSTKEPS